MRIIDTPFTKEIVTRRRVVGKGDTDNSTIAVEMVNDKLARVSYDDPETGFSSFTFPVSKVADVMSVLATIKPAPPGPTIPVPVPIIGPAPSSPA